MLEARSMPAVAVGVTVTATWETASAPTEFAHCGGCGWVYPETLCVKTRCDNILDETDALENTKQIAYEAEAIIKHAKRIVSLVKAADIT